MRHQAEMLKDGAERNVSDAIDISGGVHEETGG